MKQKKRMYEGKANWAGKKFLDNKEKALDNETLTEEQCDVLGWLCEVRHKIHCHDSNMFISGSIEAQEFNKYIDYEINERLSGCGLPIINFSVKIEDIEDDNFDMIYDEEEIAEKFGDEYNPNAGHGEDGSAYALFYKQTLEQMEKINEDIEKYLKKIDERAETDFAPSGIARIKGLL